MPVPPSRERFTGPFQGQEELAAITSRQTSPGIALAHARRDLIRLVTELDAAYQTIDRLTADQQGVNV